MWSSMTPKEIIDLTQKAYKLRYQNKFEDAQILLEQLLKLDSPPASALLLMADCLQLGDDTDLQEIEAMLRRCVGLSPESPDCHLELGHFLFVWRDNNEEAQGLLSNARLLIGRAVISADLLEAQILDDEERLDEAIAILVETARKYPKSELVLDQLAMLQDKARDQMD